MTPAASQPAASAKARAFFERVIAQIAEFEALAKEDAVLATTAPGVSGWSIAQHIEHTIKSTSGMLMIIMGSIASTANADQRPSLTARFALLTGYIPRGKSKAQGPSVPTGQTNNELRAAVAQAGAFVKNLEARLGEIEAATGRTPNPVLGALRPIDWLRFIGIHQHHHMKIICDIRKKSG